VTGSVTAAGPISMFTVMTI